MLFERSPCVLFRLMLAVFSASARAVTACTDTVQLWDVVAQLPAQCVDSSELIDCAMLEHAGLDECVCCWND